MGLHSHEAARLHHVKCDIVIRSYYKDLGWLAYALRSIRRYCRGFSNVVLIVPRSSRERLDWSGLSGDVTVNCPDYRDDYLGQQVTKLTADTFSDADYICHIDSDCVFTRPTSPDDLFEGGKPVVLMTPYSALDRHVPWRELTERALEREVPWEFMRMPPYTFPRWIYGAFREHLAAVHGRPLEDYVLSQPARGFSEFNALGAFAYLYHRDCFAWRTVDAAPPDSPCEAFWSWGGVDSATRGRLERLLA